MIKICPKCGIEKDSRGFARHLAYCTVVKKEEAIIEKSKPERKIGAGPIQLIQFSLTDERNKKIVEQEKLKKASPKEGAVLGEDGCICEKVVGDSFFCNIHDPRIECPNCGVTLVEKWEFMDPLQLYCCNLCGQFFKRHMETGEYTYG